MVAVVVVATAGCHGIEEWDNDPRGNFEALWTILDEHFCFFDQKDIDWDEVHDRYGAVISDKMTREELFNVCADMVNELRDGHTNLVSPFNTSYYREWWSDYPQNYDKRIIQENYFNFHYNSIGAFTYGMLPQNVGYIYYSSFTAGIGEGNLDLMLQSMWTADGLIIDVRDNGGGFMTNVETIVSRFISERTLVGYISHKTGPGHNDFSEPFAYYYEPAPSRLQWTKPVVVLTNRSTFSAANNFVSIMKLLPGVTVVGDVTGGGSGMPYSSELPNGWGVRMSACSVLDAEGNTTENGITPTEGCKVDMSADDMARGHDTILDFAVSLLTNQER